jgi:hypothetical protein
MKRMAMMLCVIVVALLCLQVPAKAQFGIYGGLALPTGDFGETSGDNSGLAKSGFCGGLELIFGLPIQAPIDIGIVASVTGLYNEMDLKTSQGMKVDADPWITVWPMVGGRVSLPVGQLSFYGTLQLGGVFARFPEISYTYTGSSAKSTYKADPVVKFVAFSVGAGVGFGPLRVGLRYLDAGQVEFEIKSSSATQGGSGKEKIGISALCVTVGLEL